MTFADALSERITLYPSVRKVLQSNSVPQLHHFNYRHVKRVMRLRGGGDDDFDDEIIEEDGMFKLGDFLFHSKVADSSFSCHVCAYVFLMRREQSL